MHPGPSSSGHAGPAEVLPEPRSPRELVTLTQHTLEYVEVSTGTAALDHMHALILLMAKLERYLGIHRIEIGTSATVYVKRIIKAATAKVEDEEAAEVLASLVSDRPRRSTMLVPTAGSDSAPTPWQQPANKRKPTTSRFSGGTAAAGIYQPR